MSQIPTPRSYAQHLSDLIDTFLVSARLPSLPVGSPVLFFLESAAQSDTRSTQDIFNLLNSISLDRAEKGALDLIGRSEDVIRISQTASSGTVTISDSSFDKIASRIYEGSIAPIIGSTSLRVVDGSSFPSTGQIYIGRGTLNYEGPIAYTSIADSGGYWTLTLSAGTQKFHNFGETVILAQGGNRLIAAGTPVTTSQSNGGDAVSFGTLYTASIPDGEVSVSGVSVVCKTPGSIGNISAGAISIFSSSPFSGAQVTNPGPFSNALVDELDEDYRERIRTARQTRSKGTALAVSSSVIGAKSADENKTAISSSLLNVGAGEANLYVDDGAGYETRTNSVDYELLCSAAFGGEKYFQLSMGRPVAQAFLETGLQQPFALFDGATLSVKIGEVYTSMTFHSSSFKAIESASAFEVVSAINSSNAAFNARMSDSGSRVTIFADSTENDSVELVAADSSSNSVLKFPEGKVQDVLLYKNDVLLDKDGLLASAYSEAYDNWGALVSGDTLEIELDGSPYPGVITFINADAVAAGVGYGSISSTIPLTGWRKILEYKIPGIKVDVEANKLRLSSSRGKDSGAKVVIVGGTFVSKNVILPQEAQGKPQDYEIDINLGQIKLATPLSAGDVLSAGTANPEPFIESGSFATPVTFSSANPNVLWFAVDSEVQQRKLGLVAGTSLEFTGGAVTNGALVYMSYPGSAPYPFDEVQIGDWMLITDDGLLADWGLVKISDKDVNYLAYEVPTTSYTGTPTVKTLSSSSGVTVFKSSRPPQKIVISNASNQTASNLVQSINSQIDGATAYLYKTTQYRVATNSLKSGAEIALLAQTSGAANAKLANGITKLASVSNVASAVSSSELGTPDFYESTITTVTTPDTLVLSSALYSSGRFGQFIPGAAPLGVQENNYTFYSPVEDSTVGATVLQSVPVTAGVIQSEVLVGTSAYAFGPQDSLSLVVDRDTETKRFSPNLWRVTKPTNSTYGVSNSLYDFQSGSTQSLALSFGTTPGTDFTNFAAFMRARSKFTLGSAVGLVRSTRYGKDGENSRFRFEYSNSASQSASVSLDVSGSTEDIKIRLPSGAARTLSNVRNTSSVGISVDSIDGNNLYTYRYIFNLSVASAQRQIRIAYEGRNTTAYSGTVTGTTSGATATVVSDSLPGGFSGDGHIVISGIVGDFLLGETLTAGGASSTLSRTPYGISILTLTVPGPTTSHGIPVGTTFFLNSSSPSFPSGAKVATLLSLPTSTTISYLDVPVTVAPTAITATVSVDNSGEVSLSGAGVATGDVVSFQSGSSAPAVVQRGLKIQSATSAGLVTAFDSATGVTPGGSSIVWYSINSASNFSIYQNSSASLSSLATSINALTNSPVTMVSITSATMSTASYEAPPAGLGGGSASWSSLLDGLNFIKSYVAPALSSGQYSFVFKDAVSSSLSAPCDWENELIRLVPVTAKNTVDYLSVQAVTGLSASADIYLASTSQAVQVDSKTIGDNSSVQFSASSAISSAAPLLGSTESTGITSILTTDSAGFTGGQWTKLQNASPINKAVFGSSTTLASISANGTVVIGGTAVTTKTTATSTVYFNPVGKYCLIRGTMPSGISEGGFVTISGANVDSLNQGTFRVVRASSTRLWIENQKAVKDTSGSTVIDYYTFGSLMPGDYVTISTSYWGTGNIGKRKVLSVPSSTSFVLDVSEVPMTNQGAVAALGSQSALIMAEEGSASYLFKRIKGICLNPAAPEFSYVRFDTASSYETYGEFAGTVMSAIDKLNFSLDEQVGASAYSYATGLIAESNQIVFGNDNNPSVYPGVAAIGSKVNILSPLVKRIQITLALRTRTGVPVSDVIAKVKSEVAAVINRGPVGKPIAIGDLVSAAQSVNGCLSIAVVSPTYSSGSDLIAIQPFEKPVVLNVDDDILVSLIGQ